MPKPNPGKDFAIITLDTEKAFNKVSFNWLSLVHMNLGFSGPFSHLIESMYASLIARLVVVGLLTSNFFLFKGTRQGYPFSLLLFNLAPEPLLRHLSEKAPLYGIHICDYELQTVLFTDDVFIFTKNPFVEYVLHQKKLYSVLRIKVKFATKSFVEFFLSFLYSYILHNLLRQ